MTSKRDIHVSKTPELRKIYRQYIETLDYEPTVDDRLNFPQTSQIGSEPEKNISSGKRPSSFGEDLKEYFAKNWLGWIFGIIGIAIVYLLYDSKITNKDILNEIENSNDTIGRIQDVSESNKDKNIDQDLRINESSIRIENLQKNVDEVKNDVKEIKKKIK
jgi:hypothetical protein